MADSFRTTMQGILGALFEHIAINKDNIYDAYETRWLNRSYNNECLKICQLNVREWSQFF